MGVFFENAGFFVKMRVHFKHGSLFLKNSSFF